MVSDSLNKLVRRLIFKLKPQRNSIIDKNLQLGKKFNEYWFRILNQFRSVLTILNNFRRYLWNFKCSIIFSIIINFFGRMVFLLTLFTLPVLLCFAKISSYLHLYSMTSFRNQEKSICTLSTLKFSSSPKLSATLRVQRPQKTRREISHFETQHVWQIQPSSLSTYFFGWTNHHRKIKISTPTIQWFVARCSYRRCHRLQFQIYDETRSRTIKSSDKYSIGIKNSCVQYANGFTSAKAKQTSLFISRLTQLSLIQTSLTSKWIQ